MKPEFLLSQALSHLGLEPGDGEAMDPVEDWVVEERGRLAQVALEKLWSK